MKKRLLQTITATLFLTLTLSGCQKVSTELEKKDTKTTLPQVKIWEVSLQDAPDFTLNGEVTAGQSATLTADLKGEVRAVFAKPGDKVAQNETLVLLSSDSVTQAVQTARENLLNAQKTLLQTEDVARKNLEAGRIALETTELSYKNLLAQNAVSRKQAEEALSTAKLNLNLATKSAEDNLQNTIKSVAINVQTAINASDRILGISEIYKDSANSWEYNLGTLDQSTKATAENNLRTVMSTLKKYTENYENARQLLEQTEEMLQKTLGMLHKSTTGNNYSQASLDGDINSITAQINVIKNLLSGLISSKNNLDTTLQTNNDQSQSIVNAEAQYQATLTQLKTSEESAQKQIESSKMSYESTLAGTELSKMSAQSALTNAQGNLEQAQINQEKLLIRAPFAGTVIDIPVKTGDEVNVGATLAQIENDANLKIIAYLTPEQMARVKLNDLVKIGTQSEAKISAIAGAIDSVTKKYKVEIAHQNPYLHSGQTVPLVFLTINANTNSPAILIPLTAVQVTSAESFVWLVDENALTQKRIVKTGEIKGEKILILEGLHAGEKVIVEGARLFQNAGEKVEIVE